ncbi:Rieske (2Fe-2S) protein [Cohnella terricola]|uniref:Rieske 2Fe-2S domain-containing protein n=1 Tax=Cohnella terricola TaxID=1289167 RepID=A0A559JWG7_9BACL|nr:Rieske 2Fe-2S domain-containing protein [Cohnella terricola]TVY04235.1 Rieske 2Fe-2S domain-containing protein [Cohnella terricola]
MSDQWDRHEVCADGELLPGMRKVVTIRRQEIVVLNVEGRLYALQNRCPHMGVPLAHGAVCGTMVPSDPGTHVYGCHNAIIKCPLHGWEYSLESGHNVFASEKVRIRTYEVVVEDHTIYLLTPKKIG